MTMLRLQLLHSLLLAAVVAETGIDAWLRYARLPTGMLQSHTTFADRIVTLNATDNGPLASAASELQKGLGGMLGISLTAAEQTWCPGSGTVVVATLDAYEAVCGLLSPRPQLAADGYWLSTEPIRILGQNERGALYGSFAYLALIGQGNFSTLSYSSSPSAPIRWANQWDNLNASASTQGSIERGYGGPSLFFADGAIKPDLSRVSPYGRLLASVGINGVVINNVNADANILLDANLVGVQSIADLLRPWGVAVGLSLNFASPQLVGNLSTFDPLDASVIRWWSERTDHIYALIPDFAGYLVKANSEGQPGPLTYNRTLSDGANLFAAAVRPHGGIVMFRAFVYNMLNESDWHADRANAAVDFFHGLDGTFAANVVVQIKYGPIDFQVREPPSPLFAHLPNTSVAVELQVTQEYTGQQSHLVYLAPLWQTILSFDLRVANRPSLVRDIVTGRVFHRSLGGFAGVLNFGTSDTWLGSHLSMANAFAYGRLAWNPSADPRDIVQEWAHLTFGADAAVVNAITDMAMASWPAYESYTGNLGVQTLTDILYTHFGANPASQDNNGWGQWTRADAASIGMDRTVSNGTGNAGQYPPQVAALFEEPSTTPDDLLLWYHHVPYTFRLHSGKTVIQHFYDSHYAGAATAQTFPAVWDRLRGRVDNERFTSIARQLRFQAGHALVWRDAVCEFYRNLSDIPDQAGRVRTHPYRVEAEDMALNGFAVVNVTPAECASGYHAVAANGSASASAVLRVPSGVYDVAVNYFDVANGEAEYELLLSGRSVGSWSGLQRYLGHAYSDFRDCHSATRVMFEGVWVDAGDEMVVKAVGGQAGLDYVSILPGGWVD